MWAEARRAAHVLVAGALYYTGVLVLFRRIRRRWSSKDGVYVLGFHRILNAAERQRSHSLPGMILDDAVFADLLDYLSRHVQFVSLDAFLQPAPTTSKRPRCLVTFDDGWSDTGARAVPRLKQTKTPAVVFIPAGVVGSRNGFWIERLLHAWKDPALRSIPTPLTERFAGANGAAGGREDVIERLKRMPSRQREEILSQTLPPADFDGAATVDSIMTWEQLSRMKDEGIEIGGHTVTHPLLSYEDKETVDRELRLCLQLLEEKLGTPVRAFAYPNGDWNPQVREQVRAAGYVCAFTTEARCCSGDDRFALPRFLLHDGNVTGLRGTFSPAMLNLTLAGWA